ncbi:hypothetical protein [Nostoc sp.]|uniref:hypothetical protein n=1 Tax=Nostoc sp. TaxID=1180 RepID=UPI002FF5964A
MKTAIAPFPNNFDKITMVLLNLNLMKSDISPSQLSPQHPELLAPAGNWDCAKATKVLLY